uniref:UDP-glycosyltransferases domain-containing protein n=1 Tax=Globisporangium ultimum (strain ATCC 200006 / CBS 805.95 / DAOM BR144) TaxID=431595 RepID=K3XDB5_GLOUD
PYRSQHDVFKGARVILNTAFGLEHPQPLSPLIDAVGPILPVRDRNSSRIARKHLTGSSLQSWLDAPLPASAVGVGGGGVVYLNLGTLAYIDSWQAQALTDGLIVRPDEPPVKVLWVLPTDQRNILPNDLPPMLKVKSPNGVSNLDILSHPAVKLVISHCGMVSAQEALVYEKPLLCIPFLVDQPDVAARVVDSGAGLAIDKNVLSPNEVHRAVKELLSNASYAKAAARVGRLLERAGGTNRAIEVIDAGLRLGFRHLETLDLTSPWHKTALLDVWTVYAALFCILAVFIRIQWLLLYFVVSEALSFIGGIVFGPPNHTSSMVEPSSSHQHPSKEQQHDVSQHGNESAANN